MSVQTYELQFRGAASDTLAAAFEGGDLGSEQGVTTVRARIPDQSALQGMIAQVHAFGFDLLEVRIVEEA